MQCVDLSDLLSAYADGQTLPEQTVALEAHLAGCAYCRRVLAGFQQTNALLSLAAGGDAWTPPDLRLRIRLACQRADRARHRPAWLVALTASVAAIAVTGAVVLSQALAPASVATPAVQQPASQTSVRQGNPSQQVTHPSSTTACPHQSILGIAQCLGVSRAIVPVILLDERDGHTVAMRQDQTSIMTQQSLSATATSGAALKGGGAHRLDNGAHRGMQAI